VTPIQTRWLQHLAAASNLPPHELARRLRQPLKVLADVWQVSASDLEPPPPSPPPEPARFVPPEQQLPPPEPVPHLEVGDFSHESHAGIPVPDSSGPVIPAAPKARREPKHWTDIVEAWEAAGLRFGGSPQENAGVPLYDPKGRR
jgi:hypothetical protein